MGRKGLLARRSIDYTEKEARHFKPNASRRGWKGETLLFVWRVWDGGECQKIRCSRILRDSVSRLICQGGSSTYPPRTAAGKQGRSSEKWERESQGPDNSLRVRGGRPKRPHHARRADGPLLANLKGVRRPRKFFVQDMRVGKPSCKGKHRTKVLERDRGTAPRAPGSQESGWNAG